MLLFCFAFFFSPMSLLWRFIKPKITIKPVFRKWSTNFEWKKWALVCKVASKCTLCLTICNTLDLHCHCCAENDSPSKPYLHWSTSTDGWGRQPIYNLTYVNDSNWPISNLPHLVGELKFHRLLEGICQTFPISVNLTTKTIKGKDSQAAIISMCFLN